MISLKNLYEKLSPDVKAKVGDKVMGDSNSKLPEKAIVDLAKLQGLTPKQMDEPNTEWEEQLIANLLSWVDSSTDKVANYFKSNLDTFKKLAKEYPQLFAAPQDVPVYRGTNISNATVIKLLKGSKKFKIVKMQSKPMIIFTGVKYKPNRTGQSWTLDPKVAFTFGGSEYFGRNQKTKAVLAGTTDSSFIFSPKLMTALYGKSEQEIVRVAKQGTFTVYINPTELDMFQLFHHLPAAKPFYESVVINYNKFVEKAWATAEQVAKGKSKPPRKWWLQSLLQVRRNDGMYDEWSPTKDGIPTGSPEIKTIDQLLSARRYLTAYRKDVSGSPWIRFDLDLEYSKATKQFLKSVSK